MRHHPSFDLLSYTIGLPCPDRPVHQLHDKAKRLPTPARHHRSKSHRGHRYWCCLNICRGIHLQRRKGSWHAAVGWLNKQGQSPWREWRLRQRQLLSHQPGRIQGYPHQFLEQGARRDRHSLVGPSNCVPGQYRQPTGKYLFICNYSIFWYSSQRHGNWDLKTKNFTKKNIYVTHLLTYYSRSQKKAPVGKSGTLLFSIFFFFFYRVPDTPGSLFNVYGFLMEFLLIFLHKTLTIFFYYS